MSGRRKHPDLPVHITSRISFISCGLGGAAGANSVRSVRRHGLPSGEGRVVFLFAPVFSILMDRLSEDQLDEVRADGNLSSAIVKEADVCASAPGRVEFIGNHIDYNGGWVLGATINRRVDVGLSRRDDAWIELESAADVPNVRVRIDGIEPQSGDRAWANYALGMLSVLQDEGLQVDTGMNLNVQSTLPVGAGLSSSAALELATAFALTEAFDGSFRRKELVRLAQRAENDFVGVPCGLLDQAVVAYGGERHLVRVDARTEQITAVPFPSHTGIWIFRTNQAHALADAHYQERHDEAHAARDRLNTLIGGLDHLVDVTPAQLEELKDSLPDVLYRRARHVSTEHRRVENAVEFLEEGNHAAVGELLFSSHQSSRSDYENSTPELDFIVDCLSENKNVLGARLTGAGFGGAVIAWTRDTFDDRDAREVVDVYDEAFGADLDVLPCQPAPGVFAKR